MKKLLPFFLCLTMLTAMTACGKNPNGGSLLPESEVSSSAVSSEATSMQSSDASAAAQGTISTVSQLTSSEETKPLTLVKRDEESSWIVDFVCVYTENENKEYTVKDFPEVEITDVYHGFPGNSGYLLYLKTKTVEEVKRVCELLNKRSDGCFADPAIISNDNQYFYYKEGPYYGLGEISFKPKEPYQNHNYVSSDFPTLGIEEIIHLNGIWNIELKDVTPEKSLAAVKTLWNREDVLFVCLPISVAEE